jgi:hypothetical protein
MKTSERVKEENMFLKIFNKKIGSIYCILLVVLAGFILIISSASYTDAATRSVKQKNFASPEEAVRALIDAVRASDKKELRAILGKEGIGLISSGDKVEDETGRERFAKAYDEKNSIQRATADKVLLYVGNHEWPLPIPIVKKGDAWLFDTKAGKEEILNRRIGRHELNVIEVLKEYVDAQREYASKDWDGDRMLEFAQKLGSEQGKKDGLYWEVKEGQQESPFGPLVAKAAMEGYGKKKGGGILEPYHGYYYRILTAQGKDAKGGAYNYIVDGKMILGFAVVAYPAKYGSSGIMTFVVNQEGVVYQKNLGKDTAKLAAAMKEFNPDSTWKKVEEQKSDKQ